MYKPRFKDWKPGEYRVDCKIIFPSGARLESRLPHLHPVVGNLFHIATCFALYVPKGKATPMLRVLTGQLMTHLTTVCRWYSRDNEEKKLCP